MRIKGGAIIKIQEKAEQRFAVQVSDTTMLSKVPKLTPQRKTALKTIVAKK